MNILRPTKIVPVMFFLLLLGALIQSTRGIDLRGYLDTVQNCASDGFSNPPYPMTSATNGDYFQSPFTTILLWPFSLINRGLAKIIFAALATFLLLLMGKSLGAGKLSPWSQVFLLLLFAHALSDVYLALNPLFLSLGLLWLCHVYSLRQSRLAQAAAGALFTLAIFFRATPILLLPLFLFSQKRRPILLWTFLFLGLGLATSFLLLPDGALWWNRWLQALPLYPQAANFLSPAFQSPMAVLAKWLHTLGAGPDWISRVESLLGLATFILFYVLALRAEKDHKSELAFSFLLAMLYCAFSRVWASAFLYCLPLFVLTLRSGLKPWFAVLSVLYALLPQWLYPRDLWNHLMTDWALQGLVITGLVVFSVQSESKALPGTPKNS